MIGFSRQTFDTCCVWNSEIGIGCRRHGMYFWLINIVLFPNFHITNGVKHVFGRTARSGGGFRCLAHGLNRIHCHCQVEVLNVPVQQTKKTHAKCEYNWQLEISITSGLGPIQPTEWNFCQIGWYKYFWFFIQIMKRVRICEAEKKNCKYSLFSIWMRNYGEIVA